MMKRDASSDSVVDDMPNLITWAIVRSGPFLDGMGASLERNI